MYFQELSSGEVLIGSLHEGVMASELECWRNHQKVWKVLYNGEDGSGTAIEGNLPDECQYELKKLKHSNENEFEIPLGLFKRITGYHYGFTDNSVIESERFYTFDDI